MKTKCGNSDCFNMVDKNDDSLLISEGSAIDGEYFCSYGCIGSWLIAIKKVKDQELKDMVQETVTDEFDDALKEISEIPQAPTTPKGYNIYEAAPYLSNTVTEVLHHSMEWIHKKGLTLDDLDGVFNTLMEVHEKQYLTRREEEFGTKTTVEAGA